MKSLVFVLFLALITSCSSTNQIAGIDPMGTQVTVYRRDGKMVKQVRETVDQRIVIVYKD
jgi:hypothetical protein